MAQKQLNNTTAGLAGLLSGVYTGIQNNRANNVAQGQLRNQTQEVGWKDPNRTVTQQDILGVAKGNPYLAASNPEMIAQLQSILSQKQPSSATPSVDIPVGVNGAQPTFLNQAQQAQQVQPASTPIPVTQWTPNDFLSFQAELKKRMGK